MKLRCLGSSSSGNCYILQNEKEILVIEAGIKFSAVKEAIDFNVKNIVGCLVSHRHGDHAKYVGNYLLSGIPVLAHEDVFRTNGSESSLCKPIEHQKAYRLGGFKIMPFLLEHDVPCFGFVIKHEETGKILFCTDTNEIPYSFSGLNNIIVEANYNEETMYENIRDGRLNATHQARVCKSHMDFKDTIEFLLSNDLTSVNNIVLIHLSSSNSDPAHFTKTVEERICKKVHIADKNLDIMFNEKPF